MKKTIGLISVLAIISSPLFADSVNKNSTHAISKTTDAMERDAALLLTEEEKALAKQWELKPTDWLKYKEVMKGPRGIWSPGLDPLTALGVSETDPQERRRYADIWMKVESNRMKLELAFEVERMKAGKRLHGDKLLVDNTKWIEEWRAKQNAINYQIQLFVDTQCIDECKELFEDVWASVGHHAKLDIFFKGKGGSEAIGKWAADMGIDPSLVKSRKITLNFDDGHSESMNLSTKDFPAVKVINLKTGEIRDTFKRHKN